MAGKYIKKKSTMIKRKGSALNLLGRPVNRFDYGGYPNMDNSMFPDMNHYYSNTNNPNLRVQKSETPVLQRVNGADKLFNQPVTSSKSSNPISSVSGSGSGSKSGKSGGAGYDQMADTIGQVNTGLAALNAATDKSGGTKQGQLALSQVSGGDGMNNMIGESIFRTSQILGLFDNAFTSKRKPLEETVGLYGNGGDLSRNVNLFAGGGGAAAGGGGFNFGSMMGMMGNMGGGQGGGMMGGQGGGGKANDIQNAINTGMALAANSVFESQNPSTGDLKTRLYQAGARQFNSITNQDLANEVGQRNMNYDHVGMRDIRNKSLFSEFNDSLGASAKGYEAGSSFGPWGAAIGGVVGGVSSLVGSIIGRHKAVTEKHKINKAADIATARQGINLLQAADRIDKNNNFNIAANYGVQSAYGGPLNTMADGGKIDPTFIDRINTSKANFVSRLKDPNRKTIKNWENKGQVSTHKLSYATDDSGRAIVFPMVQEVNGKLMDYSNPKYKKDWRAAMNNAIANKDTLMMSPSQAEEFTTQYKNYYPGFNEYASGGKIHINPANKGKLTATSKRTGKSFSELAHSSDPLTRKRAIFALNARKWNHKAYGGNLFDDGGPIKNPYQIDSTYVVPSYNYIDNPLPLTYGHGGNGFLGGGAGGTWEEAMARHGLTEFGKPIPPERDFNQAYGEARKAKKKSFIFDGKEYTTKYSVNPWNNIIGSQRIENKRNSAGQPRKRKGNNSNVTATPSDITFGGGGEGFKGGGAGASFINNKQYSYGGNLFKDGGNAELMKTLYNNNNLFASGGDADNTDFSNGVTEYNEGGTHEENPNGGVPVGTDSKGTPNLVEQGEVRYKDYIYSNRLSPSKEVLDKVGLSPLYSKYSFAKCAEILSRESKERPNDPISQNGLNSLMSRLKDAQDMTKEGTEKVPVEQSQPSSDEQAQPTNNQNIMQEVQGENPGEEPQENTQEEVENNADETQQYAEGGDLFNKYNGVNLFVGGGDGDVTPFDISQLVSEVPDDLGDNESEFSHNYLVDKYKNPNKASEYIPSNYKMSDINQARKFYNSFVTKAALNKRVQAYKTAFNTALNLYRNGDITRGVYYQLCSRLQSKFKNFYVNNAGKHLNKVADSHSNTTKLYNRTKGLDLTGQEIKEINQEIKFAREHPESQLGYQSRNGIVYNKNGYAVTDPDKGYSMTDPYKTRIKNDADNAFSIYVTPSEKAAFKKHHDPSDKGVKKGENPPVNGAPPVNKSKIPNPSGRKGRYVTSSVNYNSPKINLQEQDLNENLNTSAIDELGKILAQNKEGYKVTPTITEGDLQKNAKAIIDKQKEQEAKDYIDQFSKNNTGKSWDKSKLRYAPVVGSAIGVISDLMGLTNKPNYDNENWLISQANSQPNVNYKPSGNYLGYNPVDRDYALNKFNSAYSASREQLADTANGNRANLQAQLANLNNSYLGGLGDNEMKIELQNIANRNDVDKYNNSLDQANAEMAMKAQMANAEQDRFRLQAFENAAQMKNAKDAAASQAKSANLTNLFDNIGNVGREEYQSNQLQWMKNNGIFGNTPISTLYDDFSKGKISGSDYVNQFLQRGGSYEEAKYSLEHNGDMTPFLIRQKDEAKKEEATNTQNKKALDFYNKFNEFAKTEQGKTFFSDNPDLNIFGVSNPSTESSNTKAYGGKIKSKKRRYTK
jgi:hypothetical protein